MPLVEGVPEIGRFLFCFHANCGSCIAVIVVLLSAAILGVPYFSGPCGDIFDQNDSTWGIVLLVLGAIVALLCLILYIACIVFIVAMIVREEGGGIFVIMMLIYPISVLIFDIVSIIRKAVDSELVCSFNNTSIPVVYLSVGHIGEKILSHFDNAEYMYTLYFIKPIITIIMFLVYFYFACICNAFFFD